jgi:hypothetical protein
MEFHLFYRHLLFPPSPEAGVLVRKLCQLIPLSKAKRAYPRYFILLWWNQLLVYQLCVHHGVHRPIVGSESTTAG